jgi:hypothetical protein
MGLLRGILGAVTGATRFEHALEAIEAAAAARMDSGEREFTVTLDAYAFPPSVDLDARLVQVVASHLEAKLGTMLMGVSNLPGSHATLLKLRAPQRSAPAPPADQAQSREQLGSTRPSAPLPARPVPDTDWADPETILAEWRNDTEAPNWGAAMRMFDEGPPPGQRINVAEYFTRRLKLCLFDASSLPDDVTAEVSRRILVLLANVPTEPDWMRDAHLKFAPRLVRLVLAIMRGRGWQPAKYGGNGDIDVDVDHPVIAGAVATTKAPDGDYLAYFFQVADPREPGLN